MQFEPSEGCGSSPADCMPRRCAREAPLRLSGSMYARKPVTPSSAEQYSITRRSASSAYPLQRRRGVTQQNSSRAPSNAAKSRSSPGVRRRRTSRAVWIRRGNFIAITSCDPGQRGGKKRPNAPQENPLPRRPPEATMPFEDPFKLGPGDRQGVGLLTTVPYRAAANRLAL